MAEIKMSTLQRSRNPLQVLAAFSISTASYRAINSLNQEERQQLIDKIILAANSNFNQFLVAIAKLSYACFQQNGTDFTRTGNGILSSLLQNFIKAKDAENLCAAIDKETYYNFQFSHETKLVFSVIKQIASDFADKENNHAYVNNLTQILANNWNATYLNRDNDEASLLSRAVKITTYTKNNDAMVKMFNDNSSLTDNEIINTLAKVTQPLSQPFSSSSSSSSSSASAASAINNERNDWQTAEEIMSKAIESLDNTLIKKISGGYTPLQVKLLEDITSLNEKYEILITADEQIEYLKHINQLLFQYEYDHQQTTTTRFNLRHNEVDNTLHRALLDGMKLYGLIELRSCSVNTSSSNTLSEPQGCVTRLIKSAIDQVKSSNAFKRMDGGTRLQTKLLNQLEELTIAYASDNTDEQQKEYLKKIGEAYNEYCHNYENNEKGLFNARHGNIIKYIRAAIITSKAELGIKGKLADLVVTSQTSPHLQGN